MRSWLYGKPLLDSAGQNSSTALMDSRSVQTVYYKYRLNDFTSTCLPLCTNGT